MDRIAALMGRGADAARMSREFEAIVADLREAGDPDEVAGLLEEMRDGFAESA